MDIIDFINKLKSTNKTEFKSLTTIPKKEKYNEIPRIYNNIREPDFIYEADTLYMPTDTFYKYILVVVDVYSRKCDAEPMRYKNPANVIIALKKIFNRGILDKPKIFKFDAGTEFKGELKDYLKLMKISYNYSLTNRHRQTAEVEAKNKQISKYLTLYQNEKELKTGKACRKWVKQLPFLIKYINENIHLPKTKLTDEIITTEYSRDLIPLDTHVRRILDYPINAYNSKRINDYRFRSGDQRFSQDDQVVKHIILNPDMPPMYQLNKVGTDKIDGRVAYTKSQLEVVDDNEEKLITKKNTIKSLKN